MRKLKNREFEGRDIANVTPNLDGTVRCSAIEVLIEYIDIEFNR